MPETSRSAPTLRRATALTVLCAAGMLAVGCGPAASVPEDEAVAALPGDGSFDYQLGGTYSPPPGVSLVVRDRTAEPADGAYSICYVNAFQTQPGEEDLWLRKTLLVNEEGPVTDPDWPDEILLDTSTATNREAITRMLTPWIEGCAADGFDRVEFDNLDSFTRSDGALTMSDNLALATRLAGVAHDAGLSAGQKNAAEFARRLHDEARFDFAIAEECAAYDECGSYTAVYGDQVIDIEYVDRLTRDFTAMCAEPASPRAMILRDRNLVVPGDDGYVYETCER